MTTLVHADIFFFVTTIAVIVVGIAFTVALVYLANVLRQMHDIMKEVKEEVVLVREDITHVRGAIHKGEWRLRSLVDMALGVFKLKKSKKK